MTEHNQPRPDSLDWESRIDADALAALNDMATIAVIGLSPRPDRDSHRVSAYMQEHGFRIVPVNPTAAGAEILGESVYASLEEAPDEVDTVCVFRRSHQTDEPIDEAINARLRGVRQVWLQLGIVNPDGLRRARAAGLRAVENRCLMVEHRRLDQ